MMSSLIGDPNRRDRLVHEAGHVAFGTTCWQRNRQQRLAMKRWQSSLCRLANERANQTAKLG
jgi:hypothetical protein